MFAAIIRRGIIVAVGALILTLLGIMATLRIPVQMIPDLDVRTISIETRWPGATPQDIEKEILLEQEEYLRNIPNLARMEATATSGSASIELEFPFGVDATEALINVNNALSQVPQYPENVDEPQVFAASSSSNAFMYFNVGPLEGNPQSIDMVMMRDFLEQNVRTRMSSVPGVAQVTIGGGAERQAQVYIEADALAQRGLSMTQVRDALRLRNQDVSGGEIESGKRRYLIRTAGRFESLDEVLDTVIAQRGSTQIKLRDVAEIKLGHYKVRSQSWYEGSEVVGMQVRRNIGANVIDIKNNMMEEVAAINEQVLTPAGMQLQLNSDDVRYVQASIKNVWVNLVIGALFACLVMFLFLRRFTTVMAAVIGIPLCTIAAFLGLMVFGRTINVISLAGVAFAIGMTLDNSIVVLESIMLEKQREKNAFKAAVQGVQRVWPAVLASSLTTVMVFAPVLFITLEAGQLYSDIAIAISAAILASMAVAITLLPTAAARLSLRPPATQSTVLRDRVLAMVAWITSTPSRRWGVIASTVLSSALVIILLTPPAEYLPEGEEAKTFATMSAPPGYNLRTMSAIGEELRQHFYPAKAQSPDLFERGETDIPAIDRMSLSVSPESIRIIAEPKDPAHIEALMDALTAKYEEYKGMRAFAARGSIISSNDGGTRSIDVDISGPQLASLYDVANRIYQAAEEEFGNPRIQSQPSSLALAQPLLQIRPDWSQLSRTGLTAQELGFTVAAHTDGAYVDEIYLNDEQVDLFFYGQRMQNAETDELTRLPALAVYTSSGILPLNALAQIEETVDTSIVRRVDSQRMVTLNVIPPRSVPLEEGVERVRERVIGAMQERGEIPFDVQVNISGAADQLAATQAALGSNFIVAILIIYLLMVAIFSHWGYPLLIMTTIPLGVAGGLVGLALLNAVGLNQPFDMITMLGFLILMGTVINNPILIVHRAVENMQAENVDAIEAVNEAVASRLRPIAMSTITTLCGLSPLVLIPGEGTELYRGVGAIVMFGILGAAAVTLTMLPALTVMVLQRRKPD
ncbi:efflux RND transporter permease subunit [Aliidiomarina sp. Khilg15.8]